MVTTHEVGGIWTRRSVRVPESSGCSSTRSERKRSPNVVGLWKEGSDRSWVRVTVGGIFGLLQEPQPPPHSSPPQWWRNSPFRTGCPFSRVKTHLFSDFFCLWTKHTHEKGLPPNSFLTVTSVTTSMYDGSVSGVLYFRVTITGLVVGFTSFEVRDRASLSLRESNCNLYTERTTRLKNIVDAFRVTLTLPLLE